MRVRPLDLSAMAAEVGCDEEQVRQTATVLLRELHRISRCDERSATGMLLECLFVLGDEACYHLGGILDEADRSEDKLIPETMRRMPADFKQYFPIMEQWLEERTAERKLLDEMWRDGS